MTKPSLNNETKDSLCLKEMWARNSCMSPSRTIHTFHTCINKHFQKHTTAMRVVLVEEKQGGVKTNLRLPSDDAGALPKRSSYVLFVSF